MQTIDRNQRVKIITHDPRSPSWDLYYSGGLLWSVRRDAEDPTASGIAYVRQAQAWEKVAILEKYESADIRALAEAAALIDKLTEELEDLEGAGAAWGAPEKQVGEWLRVRVF